MQASGGAGLSHAEPRGGLSHRAGSLQWAGFVAVALAAVAGDQVTKRLISASVPLGEVHRVLPFLSITHVRNTGIAFGAFAGRLGIVSALTAIAVVWMVVHFARSGSGHVVFPAALGLLVGGSVSNLVDRVRAGWVTDFIHVSHWPTFNLADTFIVTGVALLLLGLGRVERERHAADSGLDPP